MDHSLKDDDLAGRMGLQLKELNKIMATLEGHKLVRMCVPFPLPHPSFYVYPSSAPPHRYRQNELKEGAQRSVGRQYFYIDYQSFCNVVKWRMAEMRRIIDQGLRNELDSKGYLCPQCHKAFQALEADRLINFQLGTFNCDVCGAELVDNENAENVVGSQDRMQRFNRQMRFILEGLRRTEDMVLPACVFSPSFLRCFGLMEVGQLRCCVVDTKSLGGGAREGCGAGRRTQDRRCDGGGAPGRYDRRGHLWRQGRGGCACRARSRGRCEAAAERSAEVASAEYDFRRPHRARNQGERAR